METKDFRKYFKSLAKKNGFESAFNGWLKESPECIFVIELMRSNFGNYYLLNIKIFVNGVFGKNHIVNKDMVKKEIGNIDRGEPKRFENALNLEFPMDDTAREMELEALFHDFLVPFSEKALTKRGIHELVEQGEIALLPAVKEELERLKTT
jgi:hypothetical protein